MRSRRPVSATPRQVDKSPRQFKQSPPRLNASSRPTRTGREQVNHPKSNRQQECQGFSGFSVDFFSSFLMVPSGDSVTFFSFFSTVPSLLTFSLSSLVMVRSQPIVSTDSAKADIIAINAVLPVFIVFTFPSISE